VRSLTALALIASAAHGQDLQHAAEALDWK